MKILNGLEESYEEHKKLNEDTTGYGQSIFEFANQWAELMEPELDRITDNDCRIEFLKQNAEELARKTSCYDGLSGYQYDCAIHVLLSYWKYGVELQVGLMY